jgi:hypothetical protein
VLGVYGLPESGWAKTDDGGILIDVPTLFLSRHKGAIFLAMSAGGAASGGEQAVGRAELSYVPYGTRTVESEVINIALHEPRSAPKGLKRGSVLISEFEAVKAAGEAFYLENRIGIAANLVREAFEQFDRLGDRELAEEQEFLSQVSMFLNAASKEPTIDADLFASKANARQLAGAWEEMADDDSVLSRWLFLPNGKVVVVEEFDGKSEIRSVSNWNRRGVGKKKASRLKFGVDEAGLFLAGEDQEVRLKRVVDKQPGESAGS